MGRARAGVDSSIGRDVPPKFLNRNFNFAAYAFGSEHQIDAAAEFMRDEIADEAAAITGLNRSLDRRSAKLAPGDRQDRGWIGVGAIPVHRDAAIRARQG